MNRVLKVVLATSFAAVLASNASAAVILGDTADARLRNNYSTTFFVDSQTDTTIGAGDESYVSLQRQYVSVFQLPDLGLVANPFTSATASFTLLSVNKVQNWMGLSLFALDARASSTVLTSDAGGGTSVGLTLASNAPAGVKTTPDLATFLNAQYAAGAGVGQYVFFSFRPTDGGEVIWNFATADNATAADLPVSDYAAIPEPASLALAGLAAGSLLTLRRRRA